MNIGQGIYRIGVHVAVPAVRLAAPFSQRLRRGVIGRATSLAALRELRARGTTAQQPMLWLHAPSVGEALMAQAILAAVKSELPRIRSAFTFFSPSAERVAARVGADWAGYLPWDRARDMRAALDALAPSCIAFVRTEIWPVLVAEAHTRGIPALLVNAVLAEDSSRMKPLARALLSHAYARLDAVGAVSDDDARNLPALGVAPGRIHVTGDARFDQVLARIGRIDPDQPLLRMFAASDRPWLVAGSTWPADEALLVPALAALRGRWRAIVAPHEPTPAHLAPLERALTDAGLRHVRLPGADAAAGLAADVDVVVVDRVGVLAELYSVAQLAYIGGGFGTAGLHSVVEPAALGVPAVYGPRHGNAREAARLAAAGGGFVVRDGAELERALERLGRAEPERAAAGAAARSFVAAHAGGAVQSARLIVQALRARRD